MIVLFGTKEGFENPVQRETDSMHYSRHSDIKRVVKTKLPDDTDEYGVRANGWSMLTAVTPIKLEKGQPCMFIDLNVPIRAVYFPLAQKPSTTFPDLCSYLMVDFRMRQGVEMFDDVKQDDPLRGVPTQEQQDEHLANAASVLGRHLVLILAKCGVVPDSKSHHSGMQRLTPKLHNFSQPLH